MFRARFDDVTRSVAVLRIFYAALPISPRASTASSRRSREPVFEKMLCRCRFTVFSLMLRSVAISRFRMPRATM